jgi:hypothetical protein
MTTQAPTAFEAFEDHAAYVTVALTRAKAITEARDVCWVLRDDYTRDQLHAVRVFMRRVEGREADEFFSGEYESGWIECDRDDSSAEPWWKVEPR